MTFVAPGHKQSALKRWGHMHLSDFVARQARFQNQRIIATHFSVRYRDETIRRYVERALPDMLGGRLTLWL